MLTSLLIMTLLGYCFTQNEMGNGEEREVSPKNAEADSDMRDSYEKMEEKEDLEGHKISDFQHFRNTCVQTLSRILTFFARVFRCDRSFMFLGSKPNESPEMPSEVSLQSHAILDARRCTVHSYVRVTKESLSEYVRPEYVYEDLRRPGLVEEVIETGASPAARLHETLHARELATLDAFPTLRRTLLDGKYPRHVGETVRIEPCSYDQRCYDLHDASSEVNWDEAYGTTKVCAVQGTDDMKALAVDLENWFHSNSTTETAHPSMMVVREVDNGRYAWNRVSSGHTEAKKNAPLNAQNNFLVCPCVERGIRKHVRT
mmetsp:Transcript_29422/g.40664  ORF Transcript_29422/g.40664 Transcript_29422/m.40664 type:complete len:316 (-) Transcript_29422:91-1038(-)